MSIKILQGNNLIDQKEYLIKEYFECLKKYSRPDKILFLSNSPNTSIEIKKEIQKKLGSYAEIWIESISSFCKKLLRTHFELLEIRPGFKVISDFEKKLILRNILQDDLKLKYFYNSQKKEGFIREISNFIDIAKKNDVFMDIDPVNEVKLQLKIDDFYKILKLYDHKLKIYNYLDFTDLTIYTRQLLQNNVDLMSFENLLVYESEDFDKVMSDIIILLYNRSKETVISYSQDLNIYSFRGSDPQYFLKHLTGEKEYICFEQSKQTDEYTIVGRSSQEQFEYIALNIASKLKAGTNPSDIAVLCRSLGAESSLLTNAFKRKNINFILNGGIGFFKHPDISDFFSLLNCIYNKTQVEDPDLIATLRLTEMLTIENIDIFRRKALLTRMPFQNIFLTHSEEKSREFWNIIEEKHEQSIKIPAVEFIYNILNDFGFFYKAKHDVQLAQIYSYLYQIVYDYAQYYRKHHMEELYFKDFMDHLFEILSAFGKDLDIAYDNSIEAVNVMTIQQAKARKFKIVYLIDLNDEDFPRQYFENPLFNAQERNVLNIYPETGPVEQYESELRLFTVACLVADKELIYCYYKTDDSGSAKEISPFIRDKDLEELSISDVIVDKNDFIISLLLNHPLKEEFLNQTNILPNTVAFLKNIIFFNPLELEDQVLKCIPNKFSPSMLQTYSSCPAKFFMKHILSIEEPDNIYAKTGTYFHRILERLHSDKNLDVELLAQEVLNEMNIGSGFESRNLKHNVLKALDRYLSHIQNSESFLVKGTEESFEIEFEGVVLRGRVDRVDEMSSGELRLVDYKTSKNAAKMTKALLTQVEKGENFQIPIYSMAYDCRFFTIYWLRKQKGSIEAIIDFNDENTVSALKASKKSLKVVLNAINEGLYVENPKTCRNCYFENSCNTI